eukprot:4409305-Lingulodinium_polyedra.AAC.1
MAPCPASWSVAVPSAAGRASGTRTCSPCAAASPRGRWRRPSWGQPAAPPPSGRSPGPPWTSSAF